MLYRTDDFTRWGAGKGSNLEPLEIDLNFWELAERLVAVEASAGEAANGIANIGVVGSQMTVYLEDGTALGPYTLPTAMIHYRGDWTAATSYSELDLVAVPNAGLYLVLQDHISGAAFDALAETAEGDPLYRWLFPMGTGGGGGGAVPVSDEGTEIMAAPADLNFAGAGVTATDDNDGTVTVTIPGGATWAEITGKPTTFAPAAHQHPWGDLTQIPTVVARLPAALGDEGQVVKVQGGVLVFAEEAGGGGPGVLPVETIAGTAYAQVAADNLKFKRTTSASAVTVTLEADVSAANDEITFQQGGAGAITFQAGAGMTLTTSGTLVSGGPGAVVGIKFLSATEAAIFGHTTGVSGAGGGGGGGEGGIPDAPSDGQHYARLDAAWVAFTPGGTLVPHTHAFGELTDVPAAFPPEAHGHAWGEITGIPATFAPEAHTHAWGDLTGVPATFAPEAHTHAFGELTDVPATFAPSAHTHPVTDFQTTGTRDGTKFLRDDGEWATPPGGGASQKGRNRLINGTFDLWQRGTSLAAATGTRYLADRWMQYSTGTTMAMSQQALAPGQTPFPMASPYHMRAVVASVTAAANHAFLAQRIEDVRSLAGQTVTISFYAKGTAGLKIGMGFRQVFGSGGSPQVNVYPGVIAATLTTSWARYEASMTINSIAGKTIGSDHYLQLMLWLDAGSSFSTIMPSFGHQSGTFDIAQVQLEVGGAATPFDWRPPALEAFLADRFYQVVYAAGRFVAAGADRFESPLSFRTRMRAVPAATIGSVGTRTNLAVGYPQVGTITDIGARYYLLSAGAGDTHATGEIVTFDSEL